MHYTLCTPDDSEVQFGKAVATPSNRRSKAILVVNRHVKPSVGSSIRPNH